MSTNPEDSTVPPTGSGVELPEPPPATHRHRSLGDLWSRLDLQRHAIAYADARVAAEVAPFQYWVWQARDERDAETRRAEAYRLRAESAERERDALRKDAERLDYIERTYSGMTNRERYLPVTMIWGKGCNGRTLREACDKYMKRDAAIAAERGDQ